jgi:protein-S-isoprenylcysteine O-methyltransferase Ste14
MNFVDKAVGTGNMNKKMGGVQAKEGEKKTFPIPTVLLIALFVYSIFLPLKLGTPWLYIGLAIYLFGIAMFLSSIITVAKTPVDQIFSRGMYRYSRHPLYLSFLFVFVGISVASASWVFLLLSMGWMVFPISQVASEEQGCIESFGIEYQEYMKRTPKWLGIPKSH